MTYAHLNGDTFSMRINSVSIHDYRAFQEPFSLNLGKYITAISGLNGIGKSTILAILTNAAELKPQDGKLISGDRFRGDFSDVIMYDGETDTPGDKATIEFDGLLLDGAPLSTVTYRATTQKQTVHNFTYRKLENDLYEKVDKQTKKTRYRLIPKIENGGWKSSSKVNWPTYYMGLSRIYPIGEANAAKLKTIDEEYSKIILEKHRAILHEKFDLDTASLEGIGIGTMFKQKSGVKTPGFGPKSNSSGQDDIGQILQVVTSFDILKHSMGDQYHGGLIAIDEIEATLHPAAQNELFDYLLTMAKKLDLQIVFTTHSITLLEHISKAMQQPKNTDNDLKVSYLYVNSDRPGLVREKVNPTSDYFRNHLSDTYRLSKNFATPLVALLEDDVARWFFSLLVANSEFPILQSIQPVPDINISWSHIVELRAAAADQLRNMLVILDPDLNCDPGRAHLNSLLQKKMLPDQPNNPNGALFTLPGSGPIEQMLWEHVASLPSTDEFFELPEVANNGLDYDNLHEANPLTRYKGQKAPYKKWFNDFRIYADAIAKSWIVTHTSEVSEFCTALNQATRRLSEVLSKE